MKWESSAQGELIGGGNHELAGDEQALRIHRERQRPRRLQTRCEGGRKPGHFGHIQEQRGLLGEGGVDHGDLLDQSPQKEGRVGEGDDGAQRAGLVLRFGGQQGQPVIAKHARDVDVGSREDLVQSASAQGLAGHHQPARRGPDRQRGDGVAEPLA